MAARAEGLTVEREVLIEASPEAVWQFLVDPAKVIRWMGVTAELEPRPGGKYRVQVQRGHFASGTITLVEPPSRLVLTFGWEHHSAGGLPPGSTTVEFELVPVSEGTLLRFSHRRLPDEAAAASHGSGWEHYLGRLQQLAGGVDPGQDPWLDP